jgi:hypothetical protein
LDMDHSRMNPSARYRTWTPGRGPPPLSEERLRVAIIDGSRAHERSLKSFDSNHCQSGGQSAPAFVSSPVLTIATVAFLSLFLLFFPFRDFSTRVGANRHQLESPAAEGVSAMAQIYFHYSHLLSHWHPSP